MIQLQKDIMEAWKSDWCNPPVGFLGGLNIYMSPTYKVQVKTHKNPIINWIYKIRYGYEERPYIQGEIYISKYGILVRDKEVLQRIKESINEPEKEN